MTPETTVQQALYGYEDGHRLLVASTELTGADQRLLLRQTDSPDAGRDGWDELLAGFPLPSGRFAWCLTWPATEMPRPGCVWTHVVILEPETLGDIGLLPLRAFRRPHGPGPELRPYRQPLALPAENGDLVRASARMHDVATTVAWALFDPPTRPVRVGNLGLPEGDRHLLLMALWREGWADLRREMSVADAPQTPRELPSGPFDLQLQTSVRRAAGSAERVVEGIVDRSPPRWAAALGRDALAPGGLGSFLAFYGPLLPARRDSVAELARLWLAWEDADVDQLIRLLARTPRDIDASDELKTRLLDPHGSPVGCTTEIPERDLIAALIRSSGDLVVDADAVRLGDRVKALVRADPAGIRVLLDARPTKQNAFAAVALDAVCEADPRALKRWVKADPAGAMEFVRARPAFAGHPAIAKAMPPGRLWEAIRTVRGARQRVALVTDVILGDGKLDPAQVAAAWAPSIGPIVEKLVSEGVDDAVVGPWLDVMTPEDRRLLARDTAPRALILAVIDREDVDHLAEWKPQILAPLVTEDLGPSAATRIFLAALHNVTRPTWAYLAMRSYGLVYGYAVSNELGDAVSLLGDVERGEIAEWDVGARVAKAANAALKRGRWPPSAALECSDRVAFQALIDADDRAGLARRILDEVIARGAEPSDSQLEALTFAAAQRADPAWVAKRLAKAIATTAGRAGRALGL